MRFTFTLLVAALASTSFTLASQVAAPGQLPTFLALQEKLSKPEASKQPAYNQDLKQFLQLGKDIQSLGGDISKVVGTGVLGELLRKLFNNNANIDQAIVDINKLLAPVGLNIRDEAEELASPGALPEFLELQNTLSSTDAAKSPNFKNDVLRFNTLGKQLESEGTNLKKVVGTGDPAQVLNKFLHATGVELHDLIADLLHGVSNVVGLQAIGLGLRDEKTVVSHERMQRRRSSGIEQL